jgi:hypothetical protein
MITSHSGKLTAGWPWLRIQALTLKKQACFPSGIGCSWQILNRVSGGHCVRQSS